MRDTLSDGHYVPLCALCGEPFDTEDPDDVVLQIQPIQFEKSKKSGRVRVIECEFTSTEMDLDGRDKLFWHLTCAAEQLLDPAVLGYRYT